MSKGSMCCSFLLMFMSSAGLSHAEDNSTLGQIFEAKAFSQHEPAQVAVEKVRHEPDSSNKTHSVESDLVVRQENLANATVESKRVEQIGPDIPFSKPETKQPSREQIAGPAPALSGLAPTTIQTRLAPIPKDDAPWSTIFLGAGIIAAIVYFPRMFGRGKTVR